MIQRSSKTELRSTNPKSRNKSQIMNHTIHDSRITRSSAQVSFTNVASCRQRRVMMFLTFFLFFDTPRLQCLGVEVCWRLPVAQFGWEWKRWLLGKSRDDLPSTEIQLLLRCHLYPAKMGQIMVTSKLGYRSSSSIHRSSVLAPSSDARSP